MPLLERLGGLRSGVEQDCGDVNARDPVDESVVGLGDQRKAPAGQVLHEPDLPEGLGAIEALREEAAGELLERSFICRPREGRVADVVVRVEARVVGPHGSALVGRHEGKSLTVARHQVQATEHMVDQFLLGWRLTCEDHHQRDVHVRGRVVLQVQERGIQRGQTVWVRHTSRLSPLAARASTIPRESEGREEKPPGPSHV